MARPELPLASQDSALLAFAADLRRLREKAGSPTYRELAASAHYSVTVLSQAASGRKLPSLAVTEAYVQACDGDPEEWRQRWHQVTEGATDPVEAELDEKAPYLGLAAYGPGDAGQFFGRDRVVDEVMAAVRSRRFVGVFGASGAGKSSILRAGLVPKATVAGPRTDGDFPVLVFTPGPRPREECALQLAALTGEAPGSLSAEFAVDPDNLHLRIRQAMHHHPTGVDLLLVVDQFEELFTLCGDPDQRAWFVTALVGAARAATSRVRVVVGVRADFYGHCGHYPELVDALRDAQVLVGPMCADELREAITQPAVAAGYKVETAVVAGLVSDAAGQPAALPLVSHALLETWRRRRGTRLTLASYQESGGIHDAIARSAENVYGALDAAQQRIARQLFVRLTAQGEGTEDTKRRLSIDTVDTEDRDTALVVEKLVQARLVAVDRNSMEITHEALIRSWPRLHDWLNDDRDGLRIHRQLGDASQAWQSLGRDRGALYRGVRLVLAGEWAEAHPDTLTAKEREFLTASLALEAGEHATTRRRTRQLRQLVAALAVLLLAATIATVFAVHAQNTATEQRDIVIARQAVSQAAALRTSNPALAVQLSAAAYRLAPTLPETRDGLLSTFATPYASRLTGHHDAVSATAYSTDGHLLATASWDHTVRIWNVAVAHRPQLVATLAGHTDEINAVAFSPNGRLLATASKDKTARLWDLTDPAHPRQLRVISYAEAVLSVAFSPGGQILATGSADNTARLWNITDPREPRALASIAEHRVAAVAFSPDGNTLATASDNAAYLWNLRDLRSPHLMAALTSHTAPVTSVAFSRDGRELATASWDRTARLWDITNPATPRSTTSIVHPDIVWSVAFSPDGHTLATGGNDSIARLWNITDPSTPGALTTLTGHTNSVYAVAFSPDGSAVATGSGDQTTLLHDLPNLSLGHTDAVAAVAISPDRLTMATGSNDGTARVWDLTDPVNPRALATIGGHARPVVAVAFSPNHHVLATGGKDGTARLWDLTDRRHPTALATITYLGDTVKSLAFSPDGHTLATGNWDSTAALLDVTNPHQPTLLAQLPDSDTSWSVAFSPDGRTLAATTRNTVVLSDVRDRRHPRQLASLTGYANGVNAVAFSPDGRTLATAGDYHSSRLWDISNPSKPSPLAFIAPENDDVRVVAFSADSKTLATGSVDGTARLWNVGDRQRPQQIATFAGHTKMVAAIAITSDGHTLVTGSQDQSVRVWETDPARVIDRICGLAYPRITQSEWNQQFPDLPYQPPCK
jgi:WD40 repeat protein